MLLLLCSCARLQDRHGAGRGSGGGAVGTAAATGKISAAGLAPGAPRQCSISPPAGAGNTAGTKSTLTVLTAGDNPLIPVYLMLLYRRLA